MITYAITGVRGFIGRWIMEHLRACGMRVLVLDGDVCTPNTFDGAYQVLLHLAGATHPGFGADPDGAWAVNVSGVRNALAACAQRDARLIFASTSGIYDPNQKMPVNEAGVVAPTSQYAASKRVGEEMCAEFAEQGNCRSTVLRIFNPYGSGQPENMLISYIITALLQGHAPQIKSPQSGRDFIHVKDVARAFIMTASGRVDYEVLNVGSGVESTVRDVCERIVRLSGSQMQPNYGIASQTATSVIADISEISMRYNWYPQIDLDAGLRSLLAISGIEEVPIPLREE